MNLCKERCVECDLATGLGFCSVTGCIKQNRVSNISVIPTLTVTDAPMVEYAPVVRCKDCKWFDRTEPSYPYGYCHAAKHGYMTSRWEISIYRKCKEDFFCADGERKEQ